MMADKTKNKSLGKARQTKQDEFYTQLSDIENELKHYRDHFKGKVIYCNCDDPRVSNFFHYFSYNFEKMGLKKLIATCYKSQERDLFSRNDSEHAIYLEYKGTSGKGNVPNPETIGIKHLKGDGDFRSAETLALLKKADIVVTNPPFSLFREYVAHLMEHEKKFLIIGSKNAITYKDIFKLIQDNQLWLGHGFSNGNAYFAIPKGRSHDFADGVYDPKTGLVKFRNVGWFTNLDIAKRHEELILYRKYSRRDYPSYVNYDAIEVSRIDDIPSDYEGAMGVPITFLDEYNPDQFEILGSSRLLGKAMSEVAERGTYAQGGVRFYLDNNDGTYRRLYDRIVIRRKTMR
jgi:hypothetical protein